MTAAMSLTLLEDSGCIFVFIEEQGIGPKVNRWSGHYTDRFFAWNHLEGLGLLGSPAAEILRHKVLAIAVSMPTYVFDPKLTLSAFHGSRITVGN